MALMLIVNNLIIPNLKTSIMFEIIKQKPMEFFGAILFLITLFSLVYFSLHIFY